MDKQTLADAIAGYQFFGLDAAGDLLVRATALLQAGTDLDAHERALDREYSEIIPDDSYLREVFEQHLAAKPDGFAPL